MRVGWGGVRRPATERTNTPGRHGESGLAAHLDLTDILLLAMRVHVLPEGGGIRKGLAAALQRAELGLRAIGAATETSLREGGRLVRDPFAHEHLAGQRLLPLAGGRARRHCGSIPPPTLLSLFSLRRRYEGMPQV